LKIPFVVFEGIGFGQQSRKSFVLDERRSRARVRVRARIGTGTGTGMGMGMGMGIIIKEKSIPLHS
jgi:hypothetical protein